MTPAPVSTAFETRDVDGPYAREGCAELAGAIEGEPDDRGRIVTYARVSQVVGHGTAASSNP